MAELRKKPTTQKEAVDQLWYAIIGTNGSGMATRLERVEKELSDHLKGCADPDDQKKPRRLEALGVIIAAMVLLDQIGLWDGIRAALFNWFSGA